MREEEGVAWPGWVWLLFWPSLFLLCYRTQAVTEWVLPKTLSYVRSVMGVSCFWSLVSPALPLHTHTNLTAISSLFCSCSASLGRHQTGLRPGSYNLLELVYVKHLLKL